MTSPAEPTWQELLLDQLGSTGQEPGRRSLALNFPQPFAGPILAAAAQRNLSITALARRSLMAVVCYDFGLDWDTVMADEPRLRGFVQASTSSERSGGRGHGPWRITEMEL